MFFLLGCFAAGTGEPAIAQAVLPEIQQAQLMPPVRSVYIDFDNGNDNNDGSATGAVKTLDKAMQLLPYGTGNNGHAYSEIIIKPGVYLLSSKLDQKFNANNGTVGYRKIIGTDTIFKDVSIRGEGTVVLDGSNLTGLGNGDAILLLRGSHISISNITVRNSLGMGVSFNTKSNGACHDVILDNVTIHNVRSFGFNIDSARKVLVQNCEFYNCCMINENQAQKLAAQSWPSALKCRWTEHITFKNNKVHHNWGEGINFNKSRYCLAYGNSSYNNYSNNFYCDNGSYAVIRNNLLYNNFDSLFWENSDSGPSYTTRSSTRNFVISNEDYSGSSGFFGYQNCQSIFFFNNIVLNGQVNIGYGQYSGSFFKNIWIANNTFINLHGRSDAILRVFNFIDESANTTYDSVHVRNNIFSLDSNKISTNWRICKAATVLPAKFYYGYNLWSYSPVIPNRYVLHDPATDLISLSIPFEGDPDRLNLIDPTVQSSLRLACSSLPFITTDFYNHARNPVTTNAGAIDFQHALPVGFISFGGVQRDTESQLGWSFEDADGECEDFLIERSENGTGFVTVGTVPAIQRYGSYEFRDLYKGTGKVFYRVQARLANSRTIYSPVIVLTAPTAISTNRYLTKISPNPASNAIQVWLRNTKVNSRGYLLIYNTAGIALYHQKIIPFSGNYNLTVPLHDDWPCGMYHAVLEYEGRKESLSFIRK